MREQKAAERRSRGKKRTGWLPAYLFALLATNAVLLHYALYEMLLGGLVQGLRLVLMVLTGLTVLVLWVLLQIFPLRGDKRVSRRVRIMMAGRRLALLGAWIMPVNALYIPLSWGVLTAAGVPPSILIANAICCALLTLLLMINGAARMFFTSRRLSILRRAVILLTMWIPIANLIVLLFTCRRVYEEYDFALYRKDIADTRKENDLCGTKYPLILVHGVLFRDLKYFNYWGRIPKELMRNGARVYYGNQEAIGTIARNAEDLAARIGAVLAETGAEKVNIIAHSKGGLDARHAIFALGTAERVASLTCVSTPHRGCLFVDRALRMPEGLYKFIARRFDKAFLKLGDKQPDFYTAIRQFRTNACAAFNVQTPDAPGVYYQSYMSAMGSASSDRLLGIPYRIIKKLEGENDGLVAIPSAKWGEFRGVFRSKSKRGVSHGDMIDLKREDYKGFDVIEAYVEIVRGLKEMGF